LSGVGIGAILGAYIRVGINYYRIWRTDTNYCVLFAQIIGSFIMGLIVSHKRHLHDKAENRLVKAFYISVSSGLCGSITTFSSWQLESNKNFFLQMDLSWGNAIGSYNGGRIFEWLVSLWIGVAIPISALRLGL
jgi:fluoride ion exporter CrcB/FEX